MGNLAALSRRKQPDLLIVDRSVHGKYENYRTPEQQVPDTMVPYPWETCMSMGESWSYIPEDHYKSTNKLIHLLVDIVSKGGNFLLNIGPAPDGNLPPIAVERLQDIAIWMKANSDAIYFTRPIFPYSIENIRLTQNKDTKKIYAVYLCEENNTKLPAIISLKGLEHLKTGQITVKGSPHKALIKKGKDGYYISIPPQLQNKLPNKEAIVFCL